MIPSVYFRRTVTDTRAVLLRGDFFDLTQVQLTELIYDFYRITADFYADRCIFDWKMDGKRISAAKLRSAVSDGCILDGQSYLSLFGDGVVPGDHAKNLTQMRRYIHSVYYNSSPPPHSTEYARFSQGYKAIYEKFVFEPLKKGASLGALREGFLTIYDIVGKKDLGYPRGIDCLCELYCAQTKPNPNLFYGKLCLRHNLISLDTDVRMYTSWLKRLALDLSGKYGSINFYIGMMRSTGLAYPDYWATFNNRDNSSDSRYRKDPTRRILTEDENQLTYHYLMAPGWANVLSPVTAAYLKKPVRTPDGVGANVEKLSGGRLFVSADCEFLGYDVPQAKPVKRVLYDALFPGGCFYMPYPTESWDAGTFSPRPRWEIVPVFPEEIEVYKGGILVAHKGNKIT